eukprot:790938-Lingulodinium_polyedra.AAC.1
MMRLNRNFATATARKQHARGLHARTSFLARAWRARKCHSRAATAADSPRRGMKHNESMVKHA